MKIKITYQEWVVIGGGRNKAQISSKQDEINYEPITDSKPNPENMSISSEKSRRIEKVKSSKLKSKTSLKIVPIRMPNRQLNKPVTKKKLSEIQAQEAQESKLFEQMNQYIWA